MSTGVHTGVIFKSIQPTLELLIDMIITDVKIAQLDRAEQAARILSLLCNVTLPS
jgi:hypothetical protein